MTTGADRTGPAHPPNPPQRPPGGARAQTRAAQPPEAPAAQPGERPAPHRAGAATATGATDASAQHRPQPACVFIGLGANLGAREHNLRAALAAIDRLPGTRVQRVSPLYRSAPVDAHGPDYLNAVAELRTTLTPAALLAALQTLEQAAGRKRAQRNAPRTLDLDILCFADQTIRTAQLTIPHPRMGSRAFVLRPLADLDPQRVCAAALQAVAAQAIERVQGAHWACGSCAQLSPQAD